MEIFSSNYELDLSITLSECLTIISASIIFIISLLQYKKTQKWKRTEFILSYLNTILESFNIKRASTMLDWKENIIHVTSNELDGKNSISVNDELILSSLRIHFDMIPNVDSFNDEESVIRLIFDDFFDKIGYFNVFINQKLIKINDVPNEIKYWIDIICDNENKSKDIIVKNAFKNYLTRYKFINFIELCKKYGYKI